MAREATPSRATPRTTALTTIPDVAWQYAEPLADMAAIAGRLAFDDSVVTVQVDAG